MRTSTKAYYANVTRDQLFDFVKLFFDDKAKVVVKTGYTGYSVIVFDYKSEGRNMNVHITDIDVKRDMEKWKVSDPLKVDSGVYVHQDKLPDKTKGISISLEYWGEAIEIVKLITYYFGGYVDDKDTDTKSHYRVKKNLHKLIKSII